MVDQRIDAGGGHRIAADQQRVERQRLAQFVVLHEFAGERIDRLPGLVLHQGRRGLDHAGKVEKRHGAELHIAFLIDTARVFEEPGISGHVRRIEFGDLGIEPRLVVRIVEPRAVVPHEPVKRLDRQQGDIVRHVAARERPKLLEAGRIGDHRWPGIKGIAVSLPDIGPPAGSVARLDDRRRHACALQADRQRQAAEARTDDDGR